MTHTLEASKIYGLFEAVLKFLLLQVEYPLKLYCLQHPKFLFNFLINSICMVLILFIHFQLTCCWVNDFEFIVK